MPTNQTKCAICKGEGIDYFGEQCVFCNGTGEPNKASESFVKNHICQCIHFDRKNCPVCNVKCHHDSSQTPRLLYHQW